MNIQSTMKNRLLWLGGSLLLIGIIFFLITRNQPSISPNTTTIKREDVVQEVSVTGRVKSSKEVSLGFEKVGRIVGVYTRVGQHVDKGQVLAELESSGARGSLLEAEARLAELKRGSRPEELVVKKAEIAKYAQEVENAYDSIATTVQDAYTKADEALHIKTAGIFSGYRSTNYKYTFSICDSQLSIKGESLRSTAEIDIELWKTEIDGISGALSNDARLSLLSRALEHVSTSSTFLDAVGKALSLDCTVSNTALDTYRTNINAARTSINTTTETLRAKKQAITALGLAHAKVSDELALMEAGTSAEIVVAQEARVLVARGEASKHLVRAPISGVVTIVNAKTGENTDSSRPAISIISNVSYKIEAYIPEADIAKVKIGNTARITLDAYGSDVPFGGQVTSIDPAETIVDNVPTYMTTFHFIKNDTRIKSGMTANIDIRTALRENVLSLPERSVITRDNKKFVRSVSPDGATIDTEIFLGLRGSEGFVEILGGATDGTEIILAPKD